MFRVTGMRLSELAGIRYDPDDPGRSDVDLFRPEITVHGKGHTTRTVKIGHDAAALSTGTSASAPARPSAVSVRVTALR